MLYDLTVSPLTSGVYKAKETNTNRVEGTVVEQRNFATLSFSGTLKERVMLIRVFDAMGRLLRNAASLGPRKRSERTQLLKLPKWTNSSSGFLGEWFSSRVLRLSGKESGSPGKPSTVMQTRS